MTGSMKRRQMNTFITALKVPAMQEFLRGRMLRIVIGAAALPSLCSCSALVETPKSLEEFYEVQIQMLVDPEVPESDRLSIAVALEKSDDRILWKVLIDHWCDPRVVDPEYGGGDHSHSGEHTEVQTLGDFCSNLFCERTQWFGVSTKEEMQAWWEENMDLSIDEIHERFAKNHGFSSWEALSKSDKDEMMGREFQKHKPK